VGQVADHGNLSQRAEWGPGVYGAEAAARHYFHKPADTLNPEEAVRLAAALPDPLGWSPRRPGRRLLARGAAIRANLPGVPAARPFPAGEAHNAASRDGRAGSLSVGTTPNLTRTGALRGEKHWRGEGNFPLQTAMIGSRRGRSAPGISTT
jgi:hypothetical protein